MNDDELKKLHYVIDDTIISTVQNNEIMDEYVRGGTSLYMMIEMMIEKAVQTYRENLKGNIQRRSTEEGWFHE
jgi:hypothetical protein